MLQVRLKAYVKISLEIANLIVYHYLIIIILKY